MARRPISGVVRDGQGRIVASASVELTLVATGAAATCYDAETAGSAYTSGVATAGSDGSYTFWVDDGDHAVLTLFNLTSSKDGYTTKVTPVAA